MVKKISIVTLIIAILSTIAVYAAEPYDFSGDISTSNDSSDQGHGSGASGTGQNDYVIAEVNDDDNRQTMKAFLFITQHNHYIPYQLNACLKGGEYEHKPSS